MKKWVSNAFHPGPPSQNILDQPTGLLPVGFVNAVYYPNWRIYRQQAPSSLSLDYISHVFYAFAWPNATGTVSLSDEYADTQIEVDGVRGCMNSFANLRSRYTHLKVILSVGGGGQGSAHFPQVASTDSTRHTFAKSVRELIDACGFNGVDIDWEHPDDPQKGSNYIALLAILRAYLPKPQYIITSALPAGQWALRYIDLAMAASYLDYINLMTYDFSGPWVDRAGHHAQLNTPQRPHNDAATISCSGSVQYALSNQVPSHKLLIGIPVYGRSFLGARRVGEPYSGSGGEEGTFEYKDLPRPGATELVDKATGAAYCVGGDGGFVTYDNPETVRMKANLVRDRKLGGMFYWTATGDVKGARSLIEAGYNSMHNL